MFSASLLRQKFFWLITLSILGISAVQYFFSDTADLQEIDRELYYFPIFVAAMRYGMRGAMVALCAIYFLYIPFIAMTWKGSIGHESARVVDLVFYFLFAFGAGFLADRDRKIRAELERNRLTISLGRITSAIVHDLKNPLISITGLLERLARGKGDCATYVPLILQDAYRMKRIVDDVLDFARPVKLKKERCSLAGVIRHAVEMCQERAEKAGVRVETELEDVRADADSFMLERALVNVISNAVEASEPGKKVVVRLHRDGDFVRISVRDFGSGMDRETIEHCFEPYFTRKQGGNGLGLPITKRIVEAHGGHVKIGQPESGGTVFSIFLPLS